MWCLMFIIKMASFLKHQELSRSNLKQLNDFMRSKYISDKMDFLLQLYSISRWLSPEKGEA